MKLKIITEDTVSVTDASNRIITTVKAADNSRPVVKMQAGVKGIKGDKGDKGDSAGSATYLCGETFPSHTPVALVDNKLYRMDSTNAQHAFAFVGFSETSGVNGQYVTVAKDTITLQGWGLTANMRYLAGTIGSIVTNNTLTNSFTKVIGLAQDANTLLIIKDYTSINKN